MSPAILNAMEIANAVAAVSRPGDVSRDRTEADRVLALAGRLTRDELYHACHTAGIEVIRPTDSKGYLLQRLRNRLTARVRAVERNEV